MDWEPRVGMRVVCLNNVGAAMLSNGAVYTVSGVYEKGGRSEYLGHGNFGVLLQEVKVPPRMDGFHPARFRPLDERRLDVFREMLAPTPKQPVRSDA